MKNAAYALCQERLKYKPGTAFAYGGASMQIGGRIVEIVGGKPWEQLFQERIAKPLGMTHTSFYGLGVTDNPLVAGGAKSSAREYTRFLQMIANKGVWQGRRILSEAAVNELCSNQTGFVPLLHPYQQPGTVMVDVGERADYGICVWRITQEPFSNALSTQTLVEIASQGRMGFSPWYDVRRNCIGVLATQTPLRKMNPTYRTLKKILREIMPLPQAVALTHGASVTTSTVTTASTVRKR